MKKFIAIPIAALIVAATTYYYSVPTVYDCTYTVTKNSFKSVETHEFKDYPNKFVYKHGKYQVESPTLKKSDFATRGVHNTMTAKDDGNQYFTRSYQQTTGMPRVYIRDLNGYEHRISQCVKTGFFDRMRLGGADASGDYKIELGGAK